MPTTQISKAIEDWSFIFLLILIFFVINGNMLPARATQLFNLGRKKGGGVGGLHSTLSSII